MLDKLRVLKNKFSQEKWVLWGISILICIQPLLDVCSYFLLKTGDTTLTTILRTLMFAGIVLYTFLISDHKKVYYIFYGVVGAYWILHMVNCFRISYQSPMSDCANFLRAVQMPALTISFITLLKKSSRMSKRIQIGFLINIVIILAVIALSYLTGMPEYTYGNYLKIGVMGWFGVHNAQSAIVMLLVPLALYFVYKLQNKCFFFISAIACFGLLFFTGTRLTFYSIFIVAAAFLFLMAINRKKQWFYYAVFLATIVIGVTCINYSPMYQRNQMQVKSYDNYQDEIGSKAMAESESESQQRTETIPVKQEDTTVTTNTAVQDSTSDIKNYNSIYNNLAGGFLADLIDHFGIEKVAAAYDYSTDTEVLLNARTKKLVFAKLSWEQQDFITKCVGYEYSTLLTDKEIYTPENDFPSLFYFFGYIGTGLYLAFILYFVVLIIRQMLKGLRNVFSMESGVICVTFLLLLGAAQLSGNVLFRPNVSIYLSIILAYLYYYFKYHDEKSISSTEGA